MSRDYSQLMRRLDVLERINRPADDLPYFVLVKRNKEGCYTAHELFHTAHGDKVHEVYVQEYGEYIAPDGFTGTCVYLVRRRCLPCLNDFMEANTANYMDKVRQHFEKSPDMGRNEDTIS